MEELELDLSFMEQEGHDALGRGKYRNKHVMLWRWYLGWLDQSTWGMLRGMENKLAEVGKNWVKDSLEVGKK